MQYKYATEQQDYSDFSSGRVFYSLPGYPAFPVRLASEIFQRCLAARQAVYRASDPCTLYDPCCGAAYHLSVLGYLHGESIREIIASDVEQEAVALARQNLGLLNMVGLEKRIHEISEMLQQYRKESHREALSSGSVLRDKLAAFVDEHPLKTKVFQASATDQRAMLSHVQPKSVDIVFTDVPYGLHSSWHDSDSSELVNPLGTMLAALYEVVSPASILAIVSDKGQKAVHENYQRLEQFQIGKRRVAILKPISR